MKDFLKIFTGTIAVVLGVGAGNWLGDKASKGIDKGFEALGKVLSKKPTEAEAPAAE